MRGIWAIFLKDWKLFLREKLALALTFVLPVVITVVIGFSVGGMAEGDIPPLDVYIVDMDGTEETAQLVKDLSELDILDAHILESDDEKIDKVISRIKQGYVPAMILIEKGFTADENDAKIRFINDPGQSVQVQIIYQTLLGLSMSIRGKDMVIEQVAGWFDDEDLGDTKLNSVRNMIEKNWGKFSSMFDSGPGDSKDGGDGKSSFFDDSSGEELGIVNEEVVGEEIDNSGYSHSVAGIAVMFTLFSLSHAAASLFEERDNGTLKRLLMSPVTITELLLGKSLSTVTKAAIQITFLFIAGMLIFQLHTFRDPLQLSIFIFAVSFMTAGLGIFIASLANTANASHMLSTLFILTFCGVGGAMFPSQMMPKVMQNIGQYTPVYWAIQGFQGIFWYQKPLSTQLDILAIIILWGIGFFVAAITIFKKKLLRN